MDKFLIRKDVYDELIEKGYGKRDLSKLTKKQITDKNGHKRTVYVRNGVEQTSQKQPKAQEGLSEEKRAKYEEMLEKVKAGPDKNALFVHGEFLNKEEAIKHLEGKLGKKSTNEGKKISSKPMKKISNEESSYNQAENAQDARLSDVYKWDRIIRDAAKSEDKEGKQKVFDKIEREYNKIKNKLPKNELDYAETYYNKAKEWLNGDMPDEVTAKDMPSGYVLNLPEKVKNQLQMAMRDHYKDMGMGRFDIEEAVENAMDSKVSDLQDLWNENQEIKTILWNAKAK